MKRIELTGQRFGKLLVTSFGGQNKEHRAMWNCICDCGNKGTFNTRYLRNGETTSCGCYHRNRLGNERRGKKFGPSKRRIDLTDRTFGRLWVRQIIPTNKGIFWFCQCVCGGDTITSTNKLKSGHTTTCGCKQRESITERNTTHDLSHTPEYQIYRGMMSRCYSETSDASFHYQERGITVCERWRNSVEAFCSDMGPRPTPKHTLERINNDGNYEPGNCKWATYTEQALNRRAPRRTGIHLLTAHGKTQNISRWCEELGISSTLLHMRIRRGWPLERVLRPKQIRRLRLRTLTDT